MFRITQDALHSFTFAEVLLMAVINQGEAERKLVDLGFAEMVWKRVREAGGYDQYFGS